MNDVETCFKNSDVEFKKASANVITPNVRYPAKGAKNLAEEERKTMTKQQIATQLQTSGFLKEMLGKLNVGFRVLAKNDISVIIEIWKGAERRKRRIVPTEIPIPEKRGQAALYAWVINSLSDWGPSLVPFAFENETILEMAKQLYRKTSKSGKTLGNYVHAICRVSASLGKTPDQMIAECRLSDGTPNIKALYNYAETIDDWLADLAAEGLASSSVANYLKGPKALFQKNRLELSYPFDLKQKITYKDRSPTPEELQYLIDLATIRDKAIIALLALGGFREGTLASLKYRHVKEDLEAKIMPIHVHVEAEITKGKYHDYDTFLGREAVDYLGAYLDQRRKGSPRGRRKPEEIHDNSPLFLVANIAKPTRLREEGIWNVMRRIYFKAGLTKKRGTRYELRVHSIRKYFKTQLTALGVNDDYIEYMMGHTVDTYQDIQMKGIEFLRNIYVAADLSIRPKTRISKLEQLKELTRVLGYDPEKVLVKDALIEPHRATLGPDQQIETLRKSLKEMLRKELLETK